MHATNDPSRVKHYSVLSLIAIAILEDGITELTKYMSDTGYGDERHQLESIVSVAIQEEEPKLIVTFKFLGDDGKSFEDGKFFIWINDDESVGGDF